MEIPTDYEEAEKFERAVGRTRLLIEARNKARLLEIAKKVAARRILNTWRWVNANPDYRTCRTRLMREFECLVNSDDCTNTMLSTKKNVKVHSADSKGLSVQKFCKG